MYSKIYLRLEPLGLELVAAAARKEGHDVQIIDLQSETQRDYFRIIDRWLPDAIAYSCNYLANVPEIIDLAKETRKRLPNSLIMVGGHSASFTAKELLEHADGALDCVLKGEGEPVITDVLAAAESDRKSLHQLPGVMTLEEEGPRPRFVASLDNLCQRETCCVTVVNILSEFSIPAPRLNLVGVAHGIVCSVALGHSTGGAIVPNHRIV